MPVIDTKPYRLAMVAYACHHELAFEPHFLDHLHMPLGTPGRAFLRRIQRHMGALKHVGTRVYPHVTVTGTLDKWTRLALIPPPVETLRDRIVANAVWGAAHEPQIHYTQGGNRMEGIRHPRMLPLHADCSSFVTLCYQWAGAPDPNGLNYNGYGFTGTLLLHGKQIPRNQALPGDYVVYGGGTGEHVSLLIKQGVDPELVSHGQEAGPRRQPASYDNRQPQRWIRSIPA